MKKIIFIVLATLSLATTNINLYPDSGDAALGLMGGVLISQTLLKPRGGSGRGDLRKDLNDAINTINNQARDIRLLNDQLQELKYEIRSLKDRLERR